MGPIRDKNKDLSLSECKYQSLSSSSRGPKSHAAFKAVIPKIASVGGFSTPAMVALPYVGVDSEFQVEYTETGLVFRILGRNQG